MPLVIVQIQTGAMIAQLASIDKLATKSKQPFFLTLILSNVAFRPWNSLNWFVQALNIVTGIFDHTCLMAISSSFLCPPWKGGHIVLQLLVGWSVDQSVCRPCVVRSISFDPFTWSIPNLVQGLTSMSRWSLLIFMSHDQRSRSNHSSQPNVLSAQYFFTPSLDQYQTWCRGCTQ